MLFLAQNTGYMQGMRQVDLRVSALAKIAAHPSSSGGYEELLRHYMADGMSAEAEAVSFLISEKFRADGSNSDPEQSGDDKPLP